MSVAPSLSTTLANARRTLLAERNGSLLASRDYDVLDLLASIGYPAGQIPVTAHTYSHNATVTVNGQPADRQGALWRKELPAGNASGPAFPGVEVEATRTGAGPGGGDVRVVERGGHFIDPVFLAPQHDADGNLLSDGRWGYTWDANNRLVAMRTHPAAVAAGVPEERYAFTCGNLEKPQRPRLLIRKTGEPAAGAEGRGDGPAGACAMNIRALSLFSQGARSLPSSLRALPSMAWLAAHRGFSRSPYDPEWRRVRQQV